VGCGSGQRPKSNEARQVPPGWNWMGWMGWDNEGAVSMPPQALSTPAFMTTLGPSSGSRSQRRLSSFEGLSSALGKYHLPLCPCGWPTLCVCRCRTPSEVRCSYIGSYPSCGCRTSLQQGLLLVTSALLVHGFKLFQPRCLDSKTIDSDMQPWLARETALGACQ
jgi:hypothetical protein